MTRWAKHPQGALCKAWRTVTLALAVACALPKEARALDNGVGRVPAMGWNSW